MLKRIVPVLFLSLLLPSLTYAQKKRIRRLEAFQTVVIGNLKKGDRCSPPGKLKAGKQQKLQYIRTEAAWKVVEARLYAFIRRKLITKKGGISNYKRQQSQKRRAYTYFRRRLVTKKGGRANYRSYSTQESNAYAIIRRKLITKKGGAANLRESEVLKRRAYAYIRRRLVTRKGGASRYRTEGKVIANALDNSIKKLALTLRSLVSLRRASCASQKTLGKTLKALKTHNKASSNLLKQTQAFLKMVR